MRYSRYVKSIAKRTPSVQGLSARPKKRLGQHFLKNKRIAPLIIEALGPQNGDFLIEVGPGKGELTIPLFLMLGKREIHCSYRGVEKDNVLAEVLRGRLRDFGERDALVISGDIRDFLKNPEESGITSAKRLKIFGNIPYYLTGHLLRLLTELEQKPNVAVFTVQLEVAERLAPSVGNMNRLAAIAGFWYETEILAKMGKNDFFPPPKVDSAVVKLTLRGDAPKNREHWDVYEAFAKKIFAQPRKTLLNNLTRLFGIKNSGKKPAETFLRTFGLNARSRPHEIDIKTLKKMARIVYNKPDGTQKK